MTYLFDKQLLRKLAVISIAVAIMAVALAGCGNSTGSIIITGTYTPSSTITLTVTPSPTSCPISSNLATPENVTLSPILVVVLFDPYSTGIMSFSDGTSSSDVLEFMSRVLNAATESGDGYGVFRLGYRWQEFDIARVVRHDSPTLVVPFIAVTPSPQITLTSLPTLTPPNTPDVEGNSIFQIPEIKATFNAQLTQTATAFSQTSVAHNATATEIKALDNCAHEEWVRENAMENANWESTKAVNRLNFLTEVGGTVEAYRKQATNLPTPYEKRTVYDGLENVSRVFSNYCSAYERCILIVVDDLAEWNNSYEDWIVNERATTEIRLDNVDVIPVLLDCIDLVSPNCDPIKDKWSPQFTAFGSRSVEYLIGQDLEKNLVEKINHLRREP